MKILVIGCIIIFSATMLNSCQKPGKCTDKMALNYDPSATKSDDYYCVYIADSILGTFNGPDTLVQIGAGDTLHYSYGYLGFNITRLERDLVFATSPENRLDQQEWKVDSIPFSIVDYANYYPDTMYGRFNLNKDTLYYYIYVSDTNVILKRWGFAVKQ